MHASKFFIPLEVKVAGHTPSRDQEMVLVCVCVGVGGGGLRDI